MVLLVLSRFGGIVAVGAAALLLLAVFASSVSAGSSAFEYNSYQRVTAIAPQDTALVGPNGRYDYARGDASFINAPSYRALSAGFNCDGNTNPASKYRSGCVGSTYYDYNVNAYSTASSGYFCEATRYANDARCTANAITRAPRTTYYDSSPAIAFSTETPSRYTQPTVSESQTTYRSGSSAFSQPSYDPLYANSIINNFESTATYDNSFNVDSYNQNSYNSYATPSYSYYSPSYYSPYSHQPYYGCGYNCYGSNYGFNYGTNYYAPYSSAFQYGNYYYSGYSTRPSFYAYYYRS